MQVWLLCWFSSLQLRGYRSCALWNRELFSACAVSTWYVPGHLHLRKCWADVSEHLEGQMCPDYSYRSKTSKFGRSMNQDLDPCFTAGAHWNVEEKAQTLSLASESAEGCRVRNHQLLQCKKLSGPSSTATKEVLSAQNLAKSVSFWFSFQTWHVDLIWKDSQLLASFSLATDQWGTDLWLCFEIAMHLRFPSLLLTGK